MIHNNINYIATKKEEQDQIRQRIKQQQDQNKLKQDQQLHDFQKHNLARKQHQQQVQSDHLKQRDENRRQKQHDQILAQELAMARLQKQEQEHTEFDTNITIDLDNGDELREKYHDKTKHYYICSYGGCGSKILTNYLSHFGNVYHIHSRNPPTKLQYIGNINGININGINTIANQYEWFDNTKEIKEEELHNYKVIYIYRNPIKAIYSRFLSPAHLRNIQCTDTTITIQNVIDNAKDLYGIEEFFDNYIDNSNNKEKRNYQIIGVKYEDFFEHISYFNTSLGLPDDERIYPKKIELVREIPLHHHSLLEIIYGNLIRKMDKMEFITIG
jgi:hypothetical protein